MQHVVQILDHVDKEIEETWKGVTEPEQNLNRVHN